MKKLNGVICYRTSEVAVLIGKSYNSLSNYAKWSEEREKNGEERFLPVPVMDGIARYWTMDDVEKIKEFYQFVKENKGIVKEYSRRCYSWESHPREIVSAPSLEEIKAMEYDVARETLLALKKKQSLGRIAKRWGMDREFELVEFYKSYDIKLNKFYIKKKKGE